MDDNFKLYAKYYNLLYQDKNYNAEVEYLITLFKKYKPDTKSILEFGSGTGNHGLIIQYKGYHVLGIERSKGMIDKAIEKGLNCKLADITDFSVSEKFDVVISMFHVISYLNDNTSLIAAFRNANKQLNPEGLFIFDVWYSPAVYEQKALPRIKKMKNDEISVTRIAEPEIDVNRNLVDVKFTILAKDLLNNSYSEFIENHPMRHFSIPEIELLAEMTGFQVLKAEEFLTGKMTSVDSWGVCFILKKRDKT